MPEVIEPSPAPDPEVEEERKDAELSEVDSKLHKYYEPTFRHGTADRPGLFAGLVCRCCGRWRD